MSVLPDFAELEGREEETLVFRKVGGASLDVEDEASALSNLVVLASAPQHGLACVWDASGESCPTDDSSGPSCVCVCGVWPRN